MVPQQYLNAALMVSLLSVWLLVALFFYLNRYTKRDYFTVWTAAWLFYALWLTLGLKFDASTSLNSIIFHSSSNAVCAISAVFLLWGSLRFLKIPVRQTLFGLFMLFLLVWTFVSPHVISNRWTSACRLEMQLPVFILLGLSSVFAGVCFFRLRQKNALCGRGHAGDWAFCCGALSGKLSAVQEHDEHLSSAGFFVAAVLQLFIAVSMIVLVLEEMRYKADQTHAEIVAVRSEKETLQVKVLTTEEQCRNLYDQVRVTDGLQKAYEELRRTQQVVVQQERLRALGQMASGVAHDVNNALVPVVAYSELLLDDAAGFAREVEHTTWKSSTARVRTSLILWQRMREFYRRRSGSEAVGPGGYQPDHRGGYRTDPSALARHVPTRGRHYSDPA